MSEPKNLSSRIDDVLAGAQQKIAAFQRQAQQQFCEREQRYQQQFLPAVARIAELLKPRLEVLSEKFKDIVHVTPCVTEHMRQASFKFDSRLARIELTFRVSHDPDVRNLVFDQTLEISPILMEFERHSSLTVPLDQVDEAVIVSWVDDRIVAFVRTFLAVHENRYYQKGIMVTDPISGTEMPAFAARCRMESEGKTYYFVSEDTRREFEKKLRLPACA